MPPTPLLQAGLLRPRHAAGRRGPRLAARPPHSGRRNGHDGAAEDSKGARAERPACLPAQPLAGLPACRACRAHLCRHPWRALIRSPPRPPARLVSPCPPCTPPLQGVASCLLPRPAVHRVGVRAALKLAKHKTPAPRAALPCLARPPCPCRTSPRAWPSCMPTQVPAHLKLCPAFWPPGAFPCLDTYMPAFVLALCAPACMEAAEHPLHLHPC